MPRLLGQIDQTKRESILAAASDSFNERGLGASLEDIARRAGVSRQTIYNQFGSKIDLIRELVRQRVNDLTAPLRQPGAEADLEATLASYAEMMMRMVDGRSYNLMRMTVQAADDIPELAAEVYANGPAASRAELADFLARECGKGTLVIADKLQAAEFFVGMVLGNRQTAALLRLPQRLQDEDIEAYCLEAARRFVRAYAP